MSTRLSEMDGLPSQVLHTATCTRRTSNHRMWMRSNTKIYIYIYCNTFNFGHFRELCGLGLQGYTNSDLTLSRNEFKRLVLQPRVVLAKYNPTKES